jgi:hypothetical protein
MIEGYDFTGTHMCKDDNLDTDTRPDHAEYKDNFLPTSDTRTQSNLKNV